MHSNDEVRADAPRWPYLSDMADAIIVTLSCEYIDVTTKLTESLPTKPTAKGGTLINCARVAV